MPKGTSVTPKATVLMSVYNGEPYVAEAIQSILDQTFQDFEFLIVDDGSTDATPETLHQYASRDKRIRVIPNPSNIGLTKSLNRGIELARGEYIARQDADDISFPERLRRQVDYLDKNPHVGVVAAWVNARSADDHVDRVWRSPESPMLIRWSLLFGNCLAHPTTMFRRQICIDANGYDETFRFAQDFELWTRLSSRTMFACLTQVLCERRVHEDMIGLQHREEQESAVCDLLQKSVADLLGTPPESELIRSLFRAEQGLALPSSHDVLKVTRLIERMFADFVARYRPSGRERQAVARDCGWKIGRLAQRNLSLWPAAALAAATVALRYDPLILFRAFGRLRRYTYPR